MWRTSAMAVFCLGSAITGCTSDSDESQSLLLLARDEEGSMAAPYLGTLRIDSAGCVELVAEFDGGPSVAIWPAGTSVAAAKRQLSVRDGRTFTDGDRLLLGGGAVAFDAASSFIASPSKAAMDCLGDETEVWVVGGDPVRSVNLAEP